MKHTKQTKNPKAFTLVELIVVITILAILGTIGFMSFNGYQSSARDGVRVSDMKNIETGLELSIVKTGVYPTPDDSVSYTGGTSSQIIQGYVGDRVSQAARMNKTPLDPLSSNRYVYSVSGDGKYYQLAVTKENLSLTPIISQVYADTSGVMVRGNYTFDPSLPSLLVVSGSVNTNSGIFDPSVCFIVDGGANTITSNSGTCLKKSEMSLKDFDSSLVGYWDMETLTGTMLKDLSGNGNDGIGSGGIVIGGTGGKIGKATLFSSGSKQFFEVLDSSNLDLYDSLTFSAIVSLNSLNDLFLSDMDIFSKHKGTAGTIFEPYRFVVGNTSEGYYSNSTTNFIYNGNIVTKTNTGYTNSTYLSSHLTIVQSGSYTPYIYERDIFGSKLNTKTSNFILTISYNDGNYKNYINGILIDNSNFYEKELWNSNGKLYIGVRSGTSNYFNGIIDDIKIYNRALSDSEILQQARVAGF